MRMRLLRAMFLQLFSAQRSARTVADKLASCCCWCWTPSPLVAMQHGRTASARQYRGHPKLVRALASYIEADPDFAVRAPARATMRANLDLLVELMLAAHRDDIAHPAPARALEFVAMNASGAIESFELDPHSPMHLGTPMSAEELEEHLGAQRRRLACKAR